MTQNKWIVLADESGERHRFNLASMKPLNISFREGVWATGVSLEQVYLMPRSKRVILETYSIWEDSHTNGVTGTQYRIADADAIAHLAERTRDPQLLELVPIGED